MRTTHLNGSVSTVIASSSMPEGIVADSMATRTLTGSCAGATATSEAVWTAGSGLLLLLLLLLATGTPAAPASSRPPSRL